MSESPQIFLSHRYSDKKRLKKLVLRLLDAGIPLWIDVPEKIMSDNRLRAAGKIAFGAYWADEIEKAVTQGESYILFCWSKQAAAAFKSGGGTVRGGLKWELQQGLARRRLIGVRLDQTPLDPLPEEAKALHWADLSDLKPGEPNETFNRLLADLKRKVEDGALRSARHVREFAATRERAFDSGASRQGLDMDFVVYEADRSAQFDAVLERLETGGASAGETRPIVVVGPDDEAPDMFLDRCWRAARDLSGSALPTLRVEWTREADFATSFRRRASYALTGRTAGGIDELAQALAAEGRRGHGRAAVTFIEASSWDKGEPARIAEWAKFWRDVQTRAAGAARVMPVLCVWMTAAERDWVRHPPTPRGQPVSNQRICAELKKLDKSCNLLGVLSPFGAEEVRPWRDRVRDALGGSTPLALETSRAFDKLFETKRGARARRISMRAFAETLSPILARGDATENRQEWGPK